MAKTTSTRAGTGRKRVSKVHENQRLKGRPAPPKKGKPGAKKPSTSSARTAAKPTPAPKKAKSGPTKAQPRRSIFGILKQRLGSGLGKQVHHLIGLGMVLLGVIAGLALVNAAGPIGQGLVDGIRWLVGWWVFILPAILFGVGLTLLLGEESYAYSSTLFGVGAQLFGLVGLFHLMTGNPAFADGADRFQESGGSLGALVAYPMERMLGFWGAVVMLVVIVSGGAIVTVLASIREVLVSSGRMVANALGKIRAALRSTGNGFARLLSRRKERQKMRSETAVVSVPRRPPPTPSPQDSTYLTEQPAASPEDNPPAEKKVKPTQKKKKKPASSSSSNGDGYQLPPLSLLDNPQSSPRSGRMIQETARQLEATLRDHEVNARLTNVVSGPTVTRYEIELAAGVKVARVTGLSGDIAYALATPDVRLLAPIPGRSAIGVEVPNKSRSLVTLGQVLASEQSDNDVHPLTIGLGEDISGRPAMINLAELPHLLIAGATGAGKSSCINSIVTSILMRATPKDVRLIMVDPKRVELGQYNGVPHLFTRVITKPKKALEALQWAVGEMDRRYELLAESGVRDITGYHEKYDVGLLEPARFDRFPYLVIVIDELNDLMMVAGRDVESAIVRIAQMARAVGIHLVIATQRPSVNVITGVIKANIPSRFAFSVASQADSRVIIDSVGAEKLIGMGDMLVITAREPRPQRVQGAWVSEGEVAAVVRWVKEQKSADYKKFTEEVRQAQIQMVSEEDEGEDPDLIRRAGELVIRSQLGSTSMLQRKLRIGFARAGRIMDILENKGIVGPSEGSKAREVLVGADERVDA
ncbi:MAG: DNA translocase FtsK [Acidimicrobiia bacterium]|nr:DNA translocase FtsK [Acidimicrobiia bacterium]